MTDTTKSQNSIWKRIKKDWNSNYIIFPVLGVAVYLLFSKPINLGFGKLGSFLFSDDMNSLVLYQWSIFALILLYSGFRFLYKKRITGMIYPLFAILTPFVVWYLINCAISVNPKMNFLDFPFYPKIPLIFSALVIWLIELGIAVWAYLRKEDETHSNRSSFITDTALDPIVKGQEDLLGFDPFAQRIADEAMMISSTESVVFGINGEWGEGKTSMINLICKKLKAKEYSIVDFHPWKTNSERAVTQLFFDVLKEGLKGKIAGINWKINSYAEALLNLDQSGFGKTFWQLFFPSDSVEKQKEKLSESMQLLDKNLIVIVDDLDRLAKNEITDVLKLMRDTANFPNLVFIAAYDRRYLDAAIRVEINEYKAENYMDKIVLWEAPIYKPQPRKYLEELKRLLKEKLGEFSEDIETVFDEDISKSMKAGSDLARKRNGEKKTKLNIETPYEINSSIFTDLRTVKKFVNYLTFNIDLVKGKVVFEDFYYLYLLRYFYPIYYEEFTKAFHELFRNNEYSGKIDIKTEHYMNLILTSEELNNERMIVLPQAIIEHIIDKSVQISPKSITYYQNFPIYFHLGNYDDITMSEFALMLKTNDITSFKEKIKPIFEDGKIIPQFSYNLIVEAHRSNFELKEINEYLEFLKELIWLAIKIDDSGFYKECHRRIKIICSIENFDIISIQTGLKEFVLQENIQYEVQYFLYLIIDEIDKSRSIQNEPYIALKDAYEISKENFKSHIDTYSGINSETINLFYCCYMRMNENKKLIIDEVVINLMKEKVTKYPSNFIKFVVVRDDGIPHSSDPIIKYYQSFADFLLKIFKDFNAFIDFLNNTNFKEQTLRAKVYLKYAAKLGIDKDGLSKLKSFIPEDNNYTEYFSYSFTQEQLLDWKAYRKVD